MVADRAQFESLTSQSPLHKKMRFGAYSLGGTLVPTVMDRVLCSCCEKFDASSLNYVHFSGAVLRSSLSGAYDLVASCLEIMLCMLPESGNHGLALTLSGASTLLPDSLLEISGLKLYSLFQVLCDCHLRLLTHTYFRLAHCEIQLLPIHCQHASHGQNH